MSSHSAIESALDAELAYRRERVVATFRPWRRVGAERRTARSAGTSSVPAVTYPRPGSPGGTATAYGAPHHP